MDVREDEMMCMYVVCRYQGFLAWGQDKTHKQTAIGEGLKKDLLGHDQK